MVLDSCPHICVSLDHTQAAKDLWHLIGSPVESQVYFNYCWSKKQDNDQDGPGFNRHENMTRITLNERHYTDIAKNAHFQWYEKIDGKNVLKTHTFKPRGLNPHFRMY